MELIQVGGNLKLGPGIASSFLPPGRPDEEHPEKGGTCPHATDACLTPRNRSHAGAGGKSEVCYWLRLLKMRPQLRRTGQRRLEMFLRDPQEWEDRIVAEVEDARPVAVRWNVGGDILNEKMAHHLSRAIERLYFAAKRRKARAGPWWFYTRSWADRGICFYLRFMVEMHNHVHVWWSVDTDNHVLLPKRTAPFKLAWMAVRREEESSHADAIRRCSLVFLDQPLQRALAKDNGGVVPRLFGGVPVCPHEWNPSVTCRSCGICWRTP